MQLNPTRFETIPLDENHAVYLSRNPGEYPVSPDDFETIWNLHPAEYHTLKFLGKEVKTPRWQQAFGIDYRYTGAKNNALPISADLQPYHDWCKKHIDPDLNGLLLNWYAGEKGHYIGAHRDDTRDLHPGSPIVTLSLGEERVFRMRLWKQKILKDIVIGNGDILVIPWETNLHWTHEVPALKKYQGRRISITLRHFNSF